jgi:exodeoxyribonuclease-1
VSEVVLKGAPFVYTSGHFPAAYWHTSAVELLARHPQQDSALIYDLRYDPTPFTTMSVAEIIKAWKFSKDPDHVQLPVKTLKYNRCPAVAPLGVMKAPATQDRLQLTLNTITKHRGLLHEQRQELSNKVLQALQLLDARREQEAAPAEVTLERVDSMLYQGGFIGGSDKTAMAVVRATDASKLATLKLKFTDTRLSTLWPLYLARNYPESLPDVERGLWEAYLHERLLGGAKQSRLAQYFERLGVLSKTTSTTDAQNYLLEELQLYGESIVPADTSNQDE